MDTHFVLCLGTVNVLTNALACVDDKLIVSYIFQCEIV